MQELPALKAPRLPEPILKDYEIQATTLLFFDIFHFRQTRPIQSMGVCIFFKSQRTGSTPGPSLPPTSRAQPAVPSTSRHAAPIAHLLRSGTICVDKVSSVNAPESRERADRSTPLGPKETDYNNRQRDRLYTESEHTCNNHDNGLAARAFESHALNRNEQQPHPRLHRKGSSAGAFNSSFKVLGIDVCLYEELN